MSGGRVVRKVKLEIQIIHMMSKCCPKSVAKDAKAVEFEIPPTSHDVFYAFHIQIIFKWYSNNPWRQKEARRTRRPSGRGFSKDPFGCK